MARNRRLLKLIPAVVAGLLTLGSLAGVASSATLDPGPVGNTLALAETPQALAERPPAARPKLKKEKPPVREAPSALLAHIPRDMKVTSKPGGGKVIGTMPGGSRYFDEPLRAWVLKTSEDGRYGKVTLPWSGRRATGWMWIDGLKKSRAPYSVEADLSRHSVKVMRKDKVVMRFKAATGAPDSPTPTGRYFVTDLVPIPQGGSFGTFAFGLSGIQTNLPVGWTGGDQLAIHGTANPSSIGTSTSAGCLRVSERALDRLQRVLELGTPVTIVP